MLVQFSFVGEASNIRHSRGEGDLWVEMDSVPSEGETVNIIGLDQAETNVRIVVWYPAGSEEYYEDERKQFVYVVLGRRRP